MRSRIKHTPGPWAVGEVRNNQIDIDHEQYEEGAISLHLARVAARQTWFQEAVANAYLIAAAPDLLKALRNFSDNVHSVQAATRGIGQFDKTQITLLAVEARFAISKATRMPN